MGDGAWSKRSYKTNYNANSECAVIIGLSTKKILYIDVKNKFCKICNEGLYNYIEPHKCYKNWKGSSSSMEAAIITEG